LVVHIHEFDGIEAAGHYFAEALVKFADAFLLVMEWDDDGIAGWHGALGLHAVSLTRDS
jgi:hypothetical protein